MTTGRVAHVNLTRWRCRRYTGSNGCVWPGPIRLLAVLASIPSPSANGFHIGPLFIHAYGLAYVVAVAAAIYITRRRWEALGGDRELVYEVAMWGFPAGVIGGRLYFLATSWNQVPPCPLSVLASKIGRPLIALKSPSAPA